MCGTGVVVVSLTTTPEKFKCYEDLILFPLILDYSSSYYCAKINLMKILLPHKIFFDLKSKTDVGVHFCYELLILHLFGILVNMVQRLKLCGIKK